MFSCLLFTVLFTVVSIISSTILKLHMGLVLFLDNICWHEFIGGYPFFYLHCAGMSKQNHWEQRPLCSANKHRTKRIIALQEVTWVTDGGMLYRIVENELYNVLSSVKNGALFSNLAALKASILTFYRKVCSSLAQERGDSVSHGCNF